MAKVVEESFGMDTSDKDYTQDGTVDLKGRPVLRSKTGRWRATSFIVGKSLISSFVTSHRNESQFYIMLM